MSGASGTSTITGAGGAPVDASGIDGGALRDWQAVRDAADIQYLPVLPPAPPKDPAWLNALAEALKAIFEPLGRLIGLSWPVLEKLLIGVAVLAVGLLLWRLLAPLLAARRKSRANPAPDWAPSAAEALALLEDADRLAALGQYDEATHLLLKRSVGQIAAARPDWLHPASTAREIAVLAGLPARARDAFALIAARVERSLFALVPLGPDDWQAARAAYTQFALTELAA